MQNFESKLLSACTVVNGACMSKVCVNIDSVWNKHTTSTSAATTYTKVQKIHLR